MRATELLLLRHAESTWNVHGLWQGHGDPPLSDAGRLQAVACAPRVRTLAPEIAVSSDLRRALETARLVAGDLELVVDPRWREWDVGLWSGLPRRAIRERWPDLYRALRSGAGEVTPPGGESRGAFAARVRAAAADLLTSHAGRRLLVVTHRGAILSLVPESDPGYLEIHSLRLSHSAGEREQAAENPADPE